MVYRNMFKFANCYASLIGSLCDRVALLEPVCQ